MLRVKVEQRGKVKFLAELGKSATETYNLLIEIYVDERQSMHWKSPTSQRKRKGTEEKVQFESNDDRCFLYPMYCSH
jgi:hypothetical protein